jgi:hypothetical protein
MYNMHNILVKHFSISIAPVRSRGESLVPYEVKKKFTSMVATSL